MDAKGERGEQKRERVNDRRRRKRRGKRWGRRGKMEGSSKGKKKHESVEEEGKEGEKGGVALQRKSDAEELYMRRETEGIENRRGHGARRMIGKLRRKK